MCRARVKSRVKPRRSVDYSALCAVFNQTVTLRLRDDASLRDTLRFKTPRDMQDFGEKLASLMSTAKALDASPASRKNTARRIAGTAPEVPPAADHVLLSDRLGGAHGEAAPCLPAHCGAARDLIPVTVPHKTKEMNWRTRAFAQLGSAESVKATPLLTRMLTFKALDGSDDLFLLEHLGEPTTTQSAKRTRFKVLATLRKWLEGKRRKAGGAGGGAAAAAPAAPNANWTMFDEEGEEDSGDGEEAGAPAGGGAEGDDEMAEAEGAAGEELGADFNEGGDGKVGMQLDEEEAAAAAPPAAAAKRLQFNVRFTIPPE